jgi:flagellin
MGLRINQNIAALNAYRNLSVTDSQMSKSLEKLSRGFRINRAADDAAGLSISEGLRSQIGGLKVAVRNAQDGVNVVQTADGALNETTSILQRMRDLSVQASNGGSQDTDAQEAANQEFSALKSELTRIADTTKFGSQKLLDGSFSGVFQVGANVNETISVSITNGTAGLDAAGLGLTAGVALYKASNTVAQNVSLANASITAIDKAIKSVSTTRASLGAAQNRFEHTINNLNVAVENLSASESQIRDTDMASEMSRFTRAQILQQAGTAMLAQANSSQQSVLRLLS